MIYKSSQTYSVQLQYQAAPSITQSHMDEQPFDMETMSMYLPNSTFAPQSVSGNMWSELAQRPFESQQQTSNFAPTYQAPYNTFQTPPYPSPQEITSPIPTRQYKETPFTKMTSPAPAFPNSPASPMVPTVDRHKGIRLSTWVGEYESRHHQPLALETGPFKK